MGHGYPTHPALTFALAAAWLLVAPAVVATMAGLGALDVDQ